MACFAQQINSKYFEGSVKKCSVSEAQTLEIMNCLLCKPVITTGRWKQQSLLPFRQQRGQHFSLWLHAVYGNTSHFMVWSRRPFLFAKWSQAPTEVFWPIGGALSDTKFLSTVWRIEENCTTCCGILSRHKWRTQAGGDVRMTSKTKSRSFWEVKRSRGGASQTAILKTWLTSNRKRFAVKATWGSGRPPCSSQHATIGPWNSCKRSPSRSDLGQCTWHMRHRAVPRHAGFLNADRFQRQKSGWHEEFFELIFKSATIEERWQAKPNVRSEPAKATLTFWYLVFVARPGTQRRHR